MKRAVVVLGMSLASLAAFGQGQRPNEGSTTPKPSAPEANRPVEKRPAQSAGPVHCALAAATAPQDTSSDACLACHGSAGPGPLFTHTHPVNVDYGPAQARSRGTLRKADAVAAKGVAVPQGKVQCVTCHDAKSPWAKWIALPAGAAARPAADRRGGNADDAPSWRIPSAVPAPALAQGAEVSSAPLCAACHTFAD
jgi:hypothetical protein